MKASKVYLGIGPEPQKNSVSENGPFEDNHLSKGKPPKTNDKRQTTMDPTRATTYPPTEEPMMDPAIILRTVLD